MAKIEFTTEESIALLKATAEALVTLKAEAKSASDALIPLIEDKAELQAVVDSLIEADKKVDLQLSEINELLNPTPVVEPEPEPVEPEPVKEDAPAEA